MQNINRCCLPFQNLRFWKIETSEKISQATFKKFPRLEIYELLFPWSPVLPIEKICTTTCVLCFKIFHDSLFFFNCFFKFFLFLIFQSFNSVGGGIGQIFIFVIRDSFGFQDFSKILFHKFFFTGTRKKNFRIWILRKRIFSKIIFSQERGNHKLKNFIGHLIFFSPLTLSKQKVEREKQTSVGGRKLRFCQYDVLTKSLGGEVSPHPHFALCKI